MKALAPLLGLGLILAPAIALPCSPAFSLDRYSPTGTSTVPANAKLQLTGPLQAVSPIQVGIVGQPLSAAVTREVPDESLWTLSNVLQVDLPTVSSGQTVRVVIDDGTGGAPVEILVTPNAPADNTPPMVVGPLTLRSFYSAVGDSCIPTEHFAIEISAADVFDDVEVAHVTAYEVTGGLMRPLSSRDVQSPPVQFLTFVSPSPLGQRCFALVARDLAGNESAPVMECINLAIGQPDAGPMGSADAGPMGSADAGTDAGNSTLAPGNGGGSGCTCLTPHSGVSIVGLWGFGMLLLARRRRARGIK